MARARCLGLALEICRKKKDRKSCRVGKFAKVTNKLRKKWNKLRIATLKVRGLSKPGKWFEIEDWMWTRGIDILLMQETRVGRTQEVRRKYYTWWLSGSEERHFTHYGVGIVINNELKQRIIDKEAGGERTHLYLLVQRNVPIILRNSLPSLKQ